MRGIALLAAVGLMLAAVTPGAAHAGDSGPRLKLPVIEITPHPAPTAPDLSTCLMQCALRDEACQRRAQSRTDRRECRLQRSLCDSDCQRYGINER